MSLLEPPQDLLTLLREALPDSVTAEEGKEADSLGSEDILAYVTFLAAGLCEVQEFAPKTWQDVLKPYLEGVDTKCEESVEKFRDSAQKATMGDDDDESYGDDDDDSHEEVCNIRFK
jgi:hypothetical protein